MVTKHLRQHLTPSTRLITWVVLVVSWIQFGRVDYLVSGNSLRNYLCSLSPPSKTTPQKELQEVQSQGKLFVKKTKPHLEKIRTAIGVISQRSSEYNKGNNVELNVLLDEIRAEVYQITSLAKTVDHPSLVPIVNHLINTDLQLILWPTEKIEQEVHQNTPAWLLEQLNTMTEGVVGISNTFQHLVTIKQLVWKDDTYLDLDASSYEGAVTGRSLQISL